MDKKPNTIESIQPLSGQFSTKADFRLNAWCYAAFAVWVVGFVLRERHPAWSPAWQATAELAPLVPGLLYVRSCARFLRGLDELQRRVQLSALLFAAMGTVLAGAVLSALGRNQILVGPLGHGLGVGGSFISLFLLWLAGSALADRRYR
ncbi:MAG: hypothetical protein RL324_693 [Verrucomicrobiota bacterium]|jgi:hypothetical protein